MFSPACFIILHLVQRDHRGQIVRDQEIYHPLVGEEERAYSDIALSARVSNNHSGFLKLIGSCLEFPYPVLVFEDLEYTPLNIRGSVGSEDGPLLPWNVRLKIAKEVATADCYNLSSHCFP